MIELIEISLIKRNHKKTSNNYYVLSIDRDRITQCFRAWCIVSSPRVSREFNRLEKRASRKMALSRRGTPNS